jgi:hypothetical protein
VHQFHHTAHFTKEFERVCEINPDLIDILTGITAFDFMGRTTCAIYAWGFLDIHIPLTDDHQDDISPDRVVPSRMFKDGMRFQIVYHADDNSLPVVFDTGATISVSPRKEDFISWESSCAPLTLQGITATSQVLCVGIVRWTIQDDQGKRHLLETKAYYVPNARVHLLSPQCLLHEHNDGTFTITPTVSIFQFPDSKATLTFKMWDVSETMRGMPLCETTFKGDTSY